MPDTQIVQTEGVLTKTAKLIASLGPADALNIFREVLLAFMIAIPVIAALMLRFFLPELEDTLTTRLDFDLTPYHPMIMGGFIGMAPAMIGGVYGLLLVDERDERTLSVLRIMPAPFGAYLTARMFLPILLSTITTIATYPLAGLSPLPIGAVIAIAVSAATVVPVAALAIVTFASNKVMGLVFFRLVVTVTILPVFAYVAAPGWDTVAWVISPYWPMKALWLANTGEAYWVPLLIAPAMNLLMTIWLYRRFVDRVET